MNAREFIAALGGHCETKRRDGYWAATSGNLTALANTEHEAVAKLADEWERGADKDARRDVIAAYHGRFDALTTLGLALWPDGCFFAGLPLRGKFSAAWVLPSGEWAISRHGGTTRQAEDRLVCAMEAMCRSRRDEPAVAAALDAVTQWRRAA